MSVALEAFAALIARDDARIDLARACLMIAQDAYPGLDVERYLGDIERMAIRLRAGMPSKVSPEERVVAGDERGEGLERDAHHSAVRREKSRGRKPNASRHAA